ncbi:hypothetical protein EXS65_02615 [Candidatus Peribacteria bacterium]|nr:hypothetical protein [Candidatus Peribacteria bacterium]
MPSEYVRISSMDGSDLTEEQARHIIALAKRRASLRERVRLNIDVTPIDGESSKTTILELRKLLEGSGCFVSSLEG